MEAATTYELAYQAAHGSWEHCGDFTSREEAVTAAMRIEAGDWCDRDDSGMAVFGISGDPASGHYEDRIGIIDGEVIDPMP